MTERRVGPCGKLCFTSKKDARKAHHRAHWRIRTYWCEECRALHVTNHEKARGRWRESRDARGG